MSDERFISDGLSEIDYLLGRLRLAFYREGVESDADAALENLKELAEEVGALT